MPGLPFVPLLWRRRTPLLEAFWAPICEEREVIIDEYGKKFRREAVKL
jgi:hypothetical protein